MKKILINVIYKYILILFVCYKIFMKKNDDLIDFGSKDIPFKLKQNLVNNIFHNVSNHYDLMNDFMS